LIFESAQYVSGSKLPIFRSLRLWLHNVVYGPNFVVDWRSGVRRRRLLQIEDYNIRTIHHIV